MNTHQAIDSAALAETADAIAEFGYAFISVIDDEEIGPFTYTVGRTLWGRAELIIHGQSASASSQYLKAIIRSEQDWRNDLRTLVPDPEVALGGMICRLESCDTQFAPIPIARTFYPDCSLLEILLPTGVDESGERVFAEPSWPQLTL